MSEKLNPNPNEATDPFAAELQAITGTFPPSAEPQKRKSKSKKKTKGKGD